MPSHVDLTANASDMIGRAILSGSVPDRGPAVFASSVATLALATFFCVARVVCRSMIVKKVVLDDYLICLSLLLAIALTVSLAVDINLGLGRQYQDIRDEDQTALNVAAYVFSVIYVCSSLVSGHRRSVANTTLVF